MDGFLRDFPDAFLPLFIAIDAIGIVPIFMSLTEGYDTLRRRRLALQAVTTALVIALVIVVTGTAIFRVLGITQHDLRVGGGLILLLLAITGLLFGEERKRAPTDDDEAARGHGDDIGIVPLGIPLVCGPGAITTLLVSKQTFGTPVTVASLLVNLAIVLVAFYFGPWLIEKLGPNTAKALAKVVNLFLAAIAVAMIRAGIMGMIEAAA